MRGSPTGAREPVIASLSTDFDLDASAALSTLDSFSTSLDQVVSDFSSGLQAALDNLSNITIATPDVDAVTTAVSDSITTAADDTTPVVTVTADASQITPEVDEAIDASDATIVIEADTSQAQAEIDELGASADAASDGGGSGGGVNGLSANLDKTAISAGDVAAQLGGVSRGIGGVSAQSVVGIASVGGIAAAIGALADNGISAVGATQRFNQVTGEFAKTINNVDVGGLTTNLHDLAVAVGSEDEGIQNASAHIFTLGVNSGTSAPQVAQTTKEIDALAARAVALRPALGDVGDVADRMTRALATGGPRATQYGIALTSAEIAARAQQIATDAGRDSVTQFDKVTAGAQLTVEKLGTTLGTDIQAGSKNAEVTLKSLTAQFSETLESFGRPLVAPTFDLIKAFEPIAVSVFQVIGKIGESILPTITPIAGAIAAITESIAGPLAQALATIAPAEAEFGQSLAQTFANFGPLITSIVELLAAAAPAITGVLKGITDSLNAANTIAKPFLAIGESLGLIDKPAKVATESIKGLTVETVKHTKAEEDNAQAQLKAFVTTQQLTQAQADAATKTATAKNGTVDYVKALQTVATAQGQVITTAAPVSAALGTTATNLGTQTQAWVDLGVAMNSQHITADQYVQVAAQFGVSSNQIAAFAADTASAISNLSSDGAKAFGDLGDAVVIAYGKFDPKATIKNLIDQETAIQNFGANLDSVAEKFPAVAQKAIQEGAVAGGALLQGFKDSDAATQQELENRLEAVTQNTSNTQQAIQQAIPGIAAANEALGREGTAAFSRTFDLAHQADTAVGAIPPAITSGDAAAAAINSGTVLATGIATAFGGSFVIGLNGQVVFISNAIRDSVGNAADGADGAIAGSQVGIDMGRGVAAGLASQTVSIAIANAATSIVTKTRGIFANLIKSGSPSKLFADTVGTDIGTGIALGISGSTSLAANAASASNLINSIVGASNSLVSAASFSGIGSSTNGGSSSTPVTINVTVPVTAAPGMTNQQAQQLGTTTGNAVGAALGTRLSNRQILATVRAS